MAHRRHQAGQGIDANALQNQSATAFNGIHGRAGAHEADRAHLGGNRHPRPVRAAARLHSQERQAGQHGRLRNKWVKVDPRNWKNPRRHDDQCRARDRLAAEQVAHLTQILEIQKEIMLSGPSQQLVKPKNVYNTLEKLIERIGLKTIEPYFSDPEEIDPATGQPKQPPPPPPDPEMVKAQSQMQMAQMQAQWTRRPTSARPRSRQVQAQADIATNEKKQQAEMVKQERDFQLKKELAIMQAQLDQQKFEREEARKDKEHQQKMAWRIGAARAQHAAGRVRHGGRAAGAQAEDGAGRGHRPRQSCPALLSR
jgi:hypothetical protein